MNAPAYLSPNIQKYILKFFFYIQFRSIKVKYIKLGDVYINAPSYLIKRPI